MPSGRLKHFCELCRKQCKDENGFKCHLNSESHQMRVRQFAINPIEHIQKASRQFEGRFIQLIKNKYPGEPKYLQELYNELIEEKKFLKFNHTQWKNLAEFGKFLQNVRNIKVIGTPPNCKILYLVHKTKDFIEATNKEKAQVEKERQKQQFQKSIAARIVKEKEYTLRRQEQFLLQQSKLQEERKHMAIPDRLQFSIEGFAGEKKRSAFYTTQELEVQVHQQLQQSKTKLNNIERLYQELKKNEGDQPEQQEIQWIREGIIVRIKPHQIDPAFHNKKCKINRRVEPFLAEITLGTANIQIDQTYLETVIPKVGHKVMMLFGKKVGEIGILRQANITEGFGIIEVKSEKYKMAFNLISKVQE